MNLDALGWSEALAKAFATATRGAPPLVAGRITRQERGTYYVETEKGTLIARLPGRLRHRASDPLDLPAVGDWVALSVVSDPALVHQILPRSSLLARKAVEDRAGEVQIIAANVDRVLIVEAIDVPVNPARLERLLAFARESGAEPLLVLNKADLAPDPVAAVARARELVGDARVLSISAKSGEGMEAVRALLPSARTGILVGSSGAGKSTIANALLGEARQATTEVREGDARGRHTTTHREMFVLPNGALLIDGPGMREFGLWLAEGALGETFPEVEALAQQCRFSDCSHQIEPGCAVRAAIEAGTLPPERLAGFLKLLSDNQRRAQRHDSRAGGGSGKKRKK
ncbi:MAG: ribosome small subunit-dependent GTPase A [Myxococcota bacterium]|nr:ribosome small subunit-dependent GTPase A [Myxococcota bacterium]